MRVKAGSGNHRFGFTYSSMYVIRSINIIENAFINKTGKARLVRGAWAKFEF